MGSFTKSAKIDGYILLALSVFFIWLGGQFDNTPNWAHHKLLVSMPSSKNTPFETSVILMLQHRKHGSLGLIVNKPGKDGDFIGGPMEQEKIYALHSTDVLLPGTMLMKDIDLGVLEGDAAVEKLKTANPQPKWHVIIKGYSGWGKRQLNSELSAGTWRLIDYDAKLVRETKPELMWEEANKKPVLQLPSN